MSAIKQADKECGGCGCDLAPLYKKALKLMDQGSLRRMQIFCIISYDCKRKGKRKNE